MLNLNVEIELTQANDSYVFPVVIQATHRTTYSEFLYQKNGELRPNKKNVLTFDTLEGAETVLQNLREKYGDKWAFELRSETTA